MRTHLLRPTLIGPILALFLLTPTAARAADAVIVYDAGTPDGSGIAAQVGGGLAGCGAGCMALRVPARTAVPARRQAMLQFAAPAGTSIVQAAVRLRYRTRQPGVVVRTVARYGGRWVDGARLRSVGGTRGTVTTARGATAVGVVLATESAIGARAVRADGENAVSIESVTLRVRDVTPPSVGWIAPPAIAAWTRGTICGTARGTDVGLGIDRLEYRVGPLAAIQSAPPGPRLQPRPAAYDATLCVDTTTLEDGAYGTVLAAVDAGPDGAAAAADAGTVRVDNTPPTVAFVPPSDPEARSPRLAIDVADAASGVASVDVTVDGLPVDLREAGGRREFTPAQPLADGLHAVVWTIIDKAGNGTTGSATFGVADATAPSIEPVAPLGTVTNDAAIVARVVDAGSGLAADAVRIAVDGVDMSAQLDAVDGVVRLVPVRPWADGEHRVRIVATDRSGNRAQREWSFAIPLPTPPPPSPVPTPPSPVAPDAAGAIALDEAVPPVRSDAVATGGRPLADRGVRLRAGRRVVRAGRTITLRGWLVGAARGPRARIEARVDGRWRAVTEAAIDARGRFAIPVRLPATGTYEVRARVGRTASDPVVLRAR